jgi:hypothetical protein
MLSILVLNILSRVGVTYKTGFGLDLLTPYSHTQLRTTGNTATAILHTFQFTVAHALGFFIFTSRILTTDLSQSHCNFKSHMKSSFHRLTPFLPLFCNCQFRNSTQFNSSYPGRTASRNSTLRFRLLLYTRSRLLTVLL